MQHPRRDDEHRDGVLRRSHADRRDDTGLHHDERVAEAVGGRDRHIDDIIFHFVTTITVANRCDGESSTRRIATSICITRIESYCRSTRRRLIGRDDSGRDHRRRSTRRLVSSDDSGRRRRSTRRRISSGDDSDGAYRRVFKFTSAAYAA